MPRYYRENGFEGIGSIANASTNGVSIIPAPGEGLSIYLLGASTFDEIRLTETDGSGATIVTAGAGMSNFPATIKVKENTAVYLLAAGTVGVTIFYYIDRT
jgi:hypothetical protein